MEIEVTKNSHARNRNTKFHKAVIASNMNGSLVRRDDGLRNRRPQTIVTIISGSRLINPIKSFKKLPLLLGTSKKMRNYVLSFIAVKLVTK